jgi:hypothetical protein
MRPKQSVHNAQARLSAHSGKHVRETDEVDWRPLSGLPARTAVRALAVTRAAGFFPANRNGLRRRLSHVTILQQPVDIIRQF